MPLFFDDLYHDGERYLAEFLAHELSVHEMGLFARHEIEKDEPRPIRKAMIEAAFPIDAHNRAAHWDKSLEKIDKKEVVACTLVVGALEYGKLDRTFFNKLQQFKMVGDRYDSTLEKRMKKVIKIFFSSRTGSSFRTSPCE